MSFDWSLYLQLAKELGSRPNDEAAKRSAVSRAYYYAFHVASHHLKAKHVALNQRLGSHERVWRVYLKSSIPECVKIGNDGNRLRVARTDADYKPDKRPTDGWVELSIQQAETIAKKVPLHVPESFSPASSCIFATAARRIRKLFKA